MLHKDIMVGHNPHFGGGTQRYVACSLTEDQ